MKATMIVQTSMVRSYKSAKGTNISSLELVGMEMPESEEDQIYVGTIKVNLPAPEGAADGPFLPLVCKRVNLDIVGLRVRMMGTEQMIEFKGRLVPNGNGAPLPPLPPVSTATTGKAAKPTVEAK